MKKKQDIEIVDDGSGQYSKVPDAKAVEGDVNQVTTTDEALARVAMILATTKKKKLLTEIDEAEVVSLACLKVVAAKTKDSMLNDFCDNFMLLRVSKKRQGRKELLEIEKASRQMPEQRLGFLRRFFGTGQTNM
jgi:hypothetical protein